MNTMEHDGVTIHRINELDFVGAEMQSREAYRIRTSLIKWWRSTDRPWDTDNRTRLVGNQLRKTVQHLLEPGVAVHYLYLLKNAPKRTAPDGQPYGPTAADIILFHASENRRHLFAKRGG